MVSADIMLAVIATGLHCYRDQPATYHPDTESQKSRSHEFVPFALDRRGDVTLPHLHN